MLISACLRTSARPCAMAGADAASAAISTSAAHPFIAFICRMIPLLDENEKRRCNNDD
nr:hypothetical protein [Lysobacter enzymogenes]